MDKRNTNYGLKQYQRWTFIILLPQKHYKCLKEERKNLSINKFWGTACPFYGKGINFVHSLGGGQI